MFLMGETQRSISSTAPGSRLRSVTSASHWSGWAQQLEHAAGQHVAGGLVAADQDQQRLVHEAVQVQPVAVDLGVDEDAHEVVAGLVPAGGDDPAGVVGVGTERLGGPHQRGAVGVVDAHERAHHVVRPASCRSSRSSGATPSASPIMISGRGAAMSHTKSQAPRSHTGR